MKQDVWRDQLCLHKTFTGLLVNHLSSLPPKLNRYFWSTLHFYISKRIICFLQETGLRFCTNLAVIRPHWLLILLSIIMDSLDSGSDPDYRLIFDYIQKLRMIYWSISTFSSNKIKTKFQKKFCHPIS